jgi:hypothetical protein
VTESFVTSFVFYFFHLPLLKLQRQQIGMHREKFSQGKCLLLSMHREDLWKRKCCRKFDRGGAWSRGCGEEIASAGDDVCVCLSSTSSSVPVFAAISLDCLFLDLLG